MRLHILKNGSRGVGKARRHGLFLAIGAVLLSGTTALGEIEVRQFIAENFRADGAFWDSCDGRFNSVFLVK
jgi:hypothetical protein